MSNHFSGYVVPVSRHRCLGVLLTGEKNGDTKVYYNTLPMTLEEATLRLKTDIRYQYSISSSYPPFLADWAERINKICQGTDVDTSFIPIDLMDYTPKQAKVIELVHKKIPVNEVYTYGQVAELCGFPRAQRFVGTTMKICRQPYIVPCQRVKNIQWIRQRNKKFRQMLSEKTPL